LSDKAALTHASRGGGPRSRQDHSYIGTRRFSDTRMPSCFLQ